MLVESLSALSLILGSAFIITPRNNISYIVFEFERVLSGWEGCKTLSYECIETLRKTHFHAVRPNRSSVILART